MSLARMPIKEYTSRNYRIMLSKQKKDLYQEKERYTHCQEKREKRCMSLYQNN